MDTTNILTNLGAIIAFCFVWFLLNRYILPKMGVET